MSKDKPEVGDVWIDNGRIFYEDNNMTDMLQKSENVAKNVANENSQDLTEQFDNDEITKGSYYCKSKLDGHICIAGFISNKGLFDCDYNGTLNKGYWEVLAPVPTFEEWHNKHLEEKIKIYERKDKQATETSIAYNELAKENEELKEIIERHKKATAKAQIRSCDFEIINTQLKELLKECKEVIKNVDTYYGNYDSTNGYLVINKINEALR